MPRYTHNMATCIIVTIDSVTSLHSIPMERAIWRCEIHLLLIFMLLLTLCKVHCYIVKICAFLFFEQFCRYMVLNVMD